MFFLLFYSYLGVKLLFKLRFYKQVIDQIIKCDPLLFIKP